LYSPLEKEGLKALLFMRDNGSAMERIMKLSQEQEKERLAKWLRMGVVYDPRNEEDYAKRLRNSETYDDWEYGTEPIPRDETWTRVARGIQ
jgi:glycosyltransferase A (GT-A) superfamily protein (DUF2064 family)